MRGAGCIDIIIILSWCVVIRLLICSSSSFDFGRCGTTIVSPEIGIHHRFFRTSQSRVGMRGDGVVGIVGDGVLGDDGYLGLGGGIRIGGNVRIGWCRHGGREVCESVRIAGVVVRRTEV